MDTIVSHRRMPNPPIAEWRQFSCCAFSSSFGLWRHRWHRALGPAGKLIFESTCFLASWTKETQSRHASISDGFVGGDSFMDIESHVWERLQQTHSSAIESLKNCALSSEPMVSGSCRRAASMMTATIYTGCHGEVWGDIWFPDTVFVGYGPRELHRAEPELCHSADRAVRRMAIQGRSSGRFDANVRVCR